MRFAITSLTCLTALASAGPLVARQFTNETSSTTSRYSSSSSVSSTSSTSATPSSSSVPGFGATGLLPSNGTTNIGPDSIVNNTETSAPSTSQVPGFGATGLLPSNGTTNVGPNSIVNNTGAGTGSTGQVPGFGATGLLPSNGTNNIGPDSIVQPGKYSNATNSGTAVVAPLPKATVTVYQAEVHVTVIAGVTVIVDVYGSPITTVIAGKPYTISPSPQTTVTKTVGSQVSVAVGPVSYTPVPAVTTTVNVGGEPSTIVYVPAAGPTSTAGAPAPAKTAAQTYQYTATASVCECPLPTTVTQYVTVQTSAQAAATGTATSAALTNCAYPATAAYPTIFPGLILPVQSSKPATAFGTQYIAEINANQEVVFQFNVQKTGSCSVALALPPKDQLTTSSWSVSGDGDFSLAKLPQSVDQSVTFAKLPTALNYTSFPVTQGGIKTIGSSFQCVAGTTATFVLKSTNGASLSFFEDYNCPAVGLLLVEA